MVLHLSIVYLSREQNTDKDESAYAYTTTSVICKHKAIEWTLSYENIGTRVFRVGG